MSIAVSGPEGNNEITNPHRNAMSVLWRDLDGTANGGWVNADTRMSHVPDTVLRSACVRYPIHITGWSQ